MKLLDILARLGILRFGTKKAVWHSAKDMPAEMLMNDVFNAERDLTTKEDLKALKQAVSGSKEDGLFCAQCGKPVSPEEKFCAACGASLE